MLLTGTFPKLYYNFAAKKTIVLTNQFNNRPDLGNKFLLERLKDGDPKAFTLLFNYYYSGLVIYADHFLFDLDMAEDVVQSVFVRLWENRQSIQSASVRYYLVNAVKNNCIDIIRKEETRKKYNQRQTNRDTEYAGEFWAETELREMIEKSMNKLAPKCREIFILHRYENLKSKEIAERLQLSPRTVETQIFKASKLLREDLKDYLFQLLFIF